MKRKNEEKNSERDTEKEDKEHWKKKNMKSVSVQINQIEWSRKRKERKGEKQERVT